MAPPRYDDGPRETSPGQSPRSDAYLSRKRSTPRPAKVVARESTMLPSGDPPLPYEDDAPPLPDGGPPEDDGWESLWDNNAAAWYFYNRFTRVCQWENPRVPEATVLPAAMSHNDLPLGNTDGSMRYPAPKIPSTSSGAPGTSSPPKAKPLHGGYNPAIHGSYDPKADYALAAEEDDEEELPTISTATGSLSKGQGDGYSSVARFNRFTGRFQRPGDDPEYHNDENKSKRQMNAFFDVDAAANSHDGRSLKAERRGKALSKKELQAYKQKRHAKKEEKRKAWLRD